MQIKGYAKKINDVNTVLCFDLEDILKEIPGDSINADEKQLQRKAVVDTIAVLSDSFKNRRIGIRVNIFNSNEFYKDLEALGKLKTQVRLTSIFLPKVENGKEILHCFNLFKEREIEFEDIIPIIESKNAYVNLNEIVTVAKDFTKKLAFGHCDFNYAHHHFPFLHQRSEKYWEWIEAINKVTEANNILFINSPYLFLDDDEGFLWNLKQLNSIVTGSVGQITLTLRQTMLCSLYKNNSIPFALKKNIL
ncbi:MAG: aldolase/citrate lyase family protein [Ignavibacteriaceae bacterium]|nr:aldolase/citrate lyase family protein [Ignavibacteriaceae bacterium]